MKKILMLVVALMAVGCAEQVPVNLNTLVQQGDLLLDRETMTPYTGPVFRENNGRRIAAFLKDGKLDGMVESYYENGQLRERGPFKDGVAEGLSEGYHENGELWVRGRYKDGEKCGQWFEEGETVLYDSC